MGKEILDWAVYLIGFIVSGFGLYKLIEKWIEAGVRKEEVKTTAQIALANAEAIKAMNSMIGFLTGEIDKIKEDLRHGQLTENEFRVLLDRCIQDLRFILDKLVESALPKRNS